MHHLALGVGQLDADDAAPGDDGDAHRHRAHGAGDVVGEADDAAGLGARRRLQLVQGDHRAGPDPHDIAADAEILEHDLQELGVLRQTLLVHPALAPDALLGPGQEVEGRALVGAARRRQVEPALPFALDPASGPHRRRARRHQSGALRRRRRPIEK